VSDMRIEMIVDFGHYYAGMEYSMPFDVGTKLMEDGYAIPVDRDVRTPVIERARVYPCSQTAVAESMHVKCSQNVSNDGTVVGGVHGIVAIKDGTGD